MSDYQHALATAIEAGAILRDDLHRPDGPRGGGSHADADDEAEKIIRHIRPNLDLVPRQSANGLPKANRD